MKNKKRLWWSFGVIGLIGAVYASLVYAQAVRSPFRSAKIGATDFVDFAFTGPPNFPFGATGISASISDLTITAVADPNATVGGGAVILNDNTELQTYDGAGTAPGDFKGNLSLDLDTLLGSNPANATTYYIYIDKALVTAPITRDDGQIVRGIRSTDFAVTTNTDLNKGRYIPIAFVRSATAGTVWSGAGSSFGNLAFKRGADATVTVNSIRYQNTDTVTTLGATGTLTHNMAVPVDDQEWIALVSISGGDDVQLDNGWITDMNENDIDYDFTGLAGADVVTVKLRDLATTPLNVPISEFERLYTSLPSFPITHGLGELPASATLKQEGQTAAGEWTTLDFDSFCDMNATDFSCAGFTTIDATHRLIITLSKAAIAAGVDEATATIRGIVSTGTQTFGGQKTFTNATTIFNNNNLRGNSGGGGGGIEATNNTGSYSTIETDTAGRGFRVVNSDYDNSSTGSALQLSLATGSGDVGSTIIAYDAGGNSYNNLELSTDSFNVDTGGTTLALEVQSDQDVVIPNGDLSIRTTATTAVFQADATATTKIAIRGDNNDNTSAALAITNGDGPGATIRGGGSNTKIIEFFDDSITSVGYIDSDGDWVVGSPAAVSNGLNAESGGTGQAAITAYQNNSTNKIFDAIQRGGDDKGQVRVFSSGAVVAEIDEESEIPVRTDGDCGVGNVCSSGIVSSLLDCVVHTNITTCTPDDGHWIRTGNQVVLTTKISYTATAANTLTTLRLEDLPFVSSNWSNADQVLGQCIGRSTVNNENSFTFVCGGRSTSSQQVDCTAYDVNTSATTAVCTIQYVIP